MKLTSRFADAFAFAFEVHREQTKKGGSVPYISHLLEVAGLVLSYGGNEDEAIAALLHDAVEDHPDIASFETIGKRFGAPVAAIVESCSDSTVIPKPPWKPRKERYIAHMREADESVLMVAAADKLANARAVMKDYRVVREDVWKRFNAPKPEQLWYYRTVTKALADRAGNGRARELIEELKRAVAQLETLCGGASNSA
ncbi:MAG TPA: HD domain-containing protein [Candidatus Binataceae bacterium]|jgi:(p)ppGpp synthase/HD superfamily hydrolase|nr:HD domain-containing protein [Candidatus Binataceae bacterium]